MNEIVKRKLLFRRKLLIFCAIFSCYVLVFSFLVQYIGEIEPCRLCKLQRIPYFFLSVIPLLGLSKIKYSYVKAMILCLLSASIILAAYHLLVIGGIVKDFCAVSTNIGSIDDFMTMLDSPLPCSKMEWKFLGIPLPGCNLLFSLVFLGLFLKRPKKQLQRVPLQ